MVIDLAARSEYTQPLREEIEQVIREDNVQEDENGVLRLKQSSLNKLWKLDSFMKESSRLSKNGSKKNPYVLSLSHKFAKTRTSHQLTPGTATYNALHWPSIAKRNSNRL